MVMGSALYCPNIIPSGWNKHDGVLSEDHVSDPSAISIVLVVSLRYTFWGCWLLGNICKTRAPDCGDGRNGVVNDANVSLIEQYCSSRRKQ